MPETLKQSTILFADISNSTRLIHERGEIEAHRLVEALLRSAAAVVEQHGGTVAKQIGDELMCIFAEPRPALEAALTLQHPAGAGAPLAALRTHIGLAHGPVGRDGDQLFGDTIHTAKRLVDLAKPGQTLVNESTARLIGACDDIHWRHVEDLRLKGHAAPSAIYEALTVEPGATVTMPALTPAGAGEHYQACRLSHLGREISLDENAPSLIFGRDAGADISIDQPFVSRHHGRLDLQRGRIIYTDQSTNGTLIIEDGARAPILVHHEQRWLRDTGALLLGARDDITGERTIRYLCGRSRDGACEPGPAVDRRRESETL